MKRMIITDLLLLHSLRYAGVDPPLTPDGIKQILSLGHAIKEFRANAVAPGIAIRFVQMHETLVEAGFISNGCRVIYSEYCGHVNSTIDMPSNVRGVRGVKNIAIHHGEVGKLVTPESYVGLAQSDRSIFNAWNLVKKRFPQRTFFLCNKTLFVALASQSKTPNVGGGPASLIAINRHEKRMQLLMRGIFAPPSVRFVDRLNAVAEILHASYDES